jgi:hypothetical protein
MHAFTSNNMKSTSKTHKDKFIKKLGSDYNNISLQGKKNGKIC